MLRMYFDNGEQLNICNDSKQLMDIIREMRNNNKKYLLNEDENCLINIDKITHIIKVDEDDEIDKEDGNNE
jgi:hypothetical protein